MAKIKVIDKAVVVTSGVKLEDIKTIEKYRPAALTLMGGEEGKEPIFKLASGAGSISKFGASFDHATTEGYAVLTLVTTYEGDKVKEHVADTLGEAMTNLNALEAKIPAVLESVKKEREEIMANITVE